VRPRGFAADAVGVVAGGDEQDGGGVDPDAVHAEQIRGGRVHETGEPRVEFVVVRIEREQAAAEGAHRDLRRLRDVVTADAWPQRGSSSAERGAGHATERFSQVIRPQNPR
jgi:hypothetical protein